MIHTDDIPVLKDLRHRFLSFGNTAKTESTDLRVWAFKMAQEIQQELRARGVRISTKSH